MGPEIGSELQLVLGWAHLINRRRDSGVITWLSSLEISLAPRILSLSKALAKLSARCNVSCVNS